MKRTIITGCLLAVGVVSGSCPPAARAEEGLALAVKGGTLGAGVEISASLLEHTRIRAGLNYLDYTYDTDISDLNYEIDTSFRSLSLMLDWHPFGGAFYVSGGALINSNTVEVTGKASRSAVPADLSQYAGLLDLASVTGEIDFSPVAPFVGLGWRSNSGQPGWGIACELGVFFQGAADVDNLRLNAPIDLNSNEEVRAFLTEQAAEIEDELSYFQYYPVASLMLTYNF